MIVHFHIHYITHPGQVLMVSGSAPETGELNEAKALEMSYWGYGNWHLDVEISAKRLLEYRYFVREGGSTQRREWGNNHQVGLTEKTDYCTLYDYWQQEPEFPVFYTSAFTESLLSYSLNQSTINYNSGNVIIKVFATMVRRGQILGISGDATLLGNWNPNKALPMQQGNFPEWSISLNSRDLLPNTHYKFVILDKQNGNIIFWEWGEPKEMLTPDIPEKQFLMYSGMSFRYQEGPWKGAGVAIPVFSLRSERSWGCGDFGDLKTMVGWAASSGQQLIQLLPVNDTSLTGTWQDSYPYNAISIFALHPQYLSIDLLPELNDKKVMKKFSNISKRLNILSEIDYEGVMSLKWSYLHELFNQEGEEVMQSVGFLTFFENNKDWLVPYAAFCHLRNINNKYDYRTWGQYAVYDNDRIEDLCKNGHPWHHDIAIHYYVQFLLHLQLAEARNFAHEKAVVLKGDIPIGISRNSVEAWKEPRLFNMEVQIGAPPDDFSVSGQNWGFPGYNWEQMAKEDYKWWKRRFVKMSDYFDAYRIDHILGFFRIWEIPSHSIQGLLGHFSPALPLSVQEIRDFGFVFDESMTNPVFTEVTLKELFKEKTEDIKNKYLVEHTKGTFKFDKNFDSQVKIHDAFAGKESDDEKILMENLFLLCNEVLFVRDSRNPANLHPRISGQFTFRYKALNNDQKYAFENLYNQFFYQRNINFWKSKAMEKLPSLLNATKMMVCGEDLGMIPSCVPEVMNQLNILSLEIQRMPKALGVKFEHLNSIPYLSVCTTSTHDMNPVRAWWKENSENSQQYYQQVLWKQGSAPEDCTPEIAKEILQLHLASPAMWVIIPLQDWMAMNGQLRRENPEEERINVPSNPRHYWRYRMHITLEQLLKEDGFNDEVLSMIKKSARC